MHDPTTEVARRLESALALDAELCPCKNEDECDCGAPVAFAVTRVAAQS